MQEIDSKSKQTIMAGLVDYGDSDEETAEPVAAPAVAVAPASKAAPKQGLGLPQAKKSGGLDFLNSECPGTVAEADVYHVRSESRNYMLIHEISLPVCSKSCTT